MTRILMLWRRADVKPYLLIAVAVLVLWVVWLQLAGCTYTINLTVSLPSDNTPTVSVEPQTKDSFNL